MSAPIIMLGDNNSLHAKFYIVSAKSSVINIYGFICGGIYVVEHMHGFVLMT